MSYVVPSPVDDQKPSRLRDLRRPSELPTSTSVSQPERFAIDDDFWVCEISTADELRSLGDDWDDLAAHAARPNVFLERPLLEPGWTTFAAASPDDAKVSVVAIYRRGKATQYPPVLIGLFACGVDRSLGRAAGPVLSLWQHIYSFDATPLLRAGWTVSAVQAFFQWAKKRRSECGLIRFRDTAADGPLMIALSEWRRVNQTITFEVDSINRALLQPRTSYEDYIEHAISPSTRRELRRQSRRLSEVGELITTATVDRAEANAWVDRFLELEKSGWKQGTAIAQNEQHAAYFRQCVQAAADQQQFEGLEMTLDGRPIAMKCNFDSTSHNERRTGVAFKIAFDETFKKFSPGVLLELETIRRRHEQDDPIPLDSCAKAGHPMIDRLWCDRTPRTDIVIANGSQRAGLWIGVRQALRTVRRTLRPSVAEMSRPNF